MQKNFNLAAEAISEAELALNSWGVEYTRQPDGSLLVPGSLNLSGKGLTHLPDLSNVTVAGDVDCNSNQLISLDGAPQTRGNFHCVGNRLTTLKGAPQNPRSLFCDHNQLTSLQYAPQSVACAFSCKRNPLSSLAGAPENFVYLQTDFGDFVWGQTVPEALRSPPKPTATSGAKTSSSPRPAARQGL